MVIVHENILKWFGNVINLEVINDFVFLGSILDKEGGLEKDQKENDSRTFCKLLANVFKGRKISHNIKPA